MYRHGRKKDEELSELTTTEFRAHVLNSLDKLNHRDTFRKGRDELLSLVDQVSSQDESLNIFVVSPFFSLNSHVTVRIVSLN